MNTSNQWRLKKLRDLIDASKTEEYSNLDYDRYKILNFHGSIYIQQFAGWVRITVTGIKAQRLVELVFGPTTQRDCKDYHTWALR